MFDVVAVWSGNDVLDGVQPCRNLGQYNLLLLLHQFLLFVGFQVLVHGCVGNSHVDTQLLADDALDSRCASTSGRYRKTIRARMVADSHGQSK